MYKRCTLFLGLLLSGTAFADNASLVQQGQALLGWLTQTPTQQDCKSKTGNASNVCLARANHTWQGSLGSSQALESQNTQSSPPNPVKGPRLPASTVSPKPTTNNQNKTEPLPQAKQPYSFFRFT